MPSRKRKQSTKLSDDASSDHMTPTHDVISDKHVTKPIIKPTSRVMTRRKQHSERHQEAEEDLQSQLWQLGDNIPPYSDTSIDVHVINPKRRKPTSRATARPKPERSESPEVDVQNKILHCPIDHEIILAERVSQKQNSNVATSTASLESQAVNLQEPTTGFLDNLPPRSDIRSEEILVKPEGRKSAARGTTLHKQAHSEGQMPPSDDVISIDHVIPHDKAIISLSNSTPKKMQSILRNRRHSGHQDVEPQETIQSRFKKKFANILNSIVNRDTVEARKPNHHGGNACEEEKTEPSSNCQDFTTFSARKEQTDGNGKELAKGRFQGQRKSDNNNGKESETVKRNAKKESSSNEDREDSSIDYKMTIGPSSVCLMQSPCIKLQKPINLEGTSTMAKYSRDNIISKHTDASKDMNMSIVEQKSVNGNAYFQTDTPAKVSGLLQTICQRSVSTEASSLCIGSASKNTKNESKDKITDFSDDSSTKYISDANGFSTIDNNLDDEVNSDRKVVPVQGYYTENNLNYLDDCDALPYPTDATCMFTNLQDTALYVTEMLRETVKERSVFDDVLHSNTTTVPRFTSVEANNNLYKEETRQCHDRIRTFGKNSDLNSTSSVSVNMKNELVEGVNKYSGIEEGNVSTDLTSGIQSKFCQYSSNSLEMSNDPDKNIASSSETYQTGSDATTLDNLQPSNTSQIDVNPDSNNTSRPDRVNTTPVITTEDQINIHFDELSRIVFNVANKIKRTEDCKEKWLKKISDTNLSKQCSVLTLKTKSYIQSNMNIVSQINKALIKTIGYYKFITFLFRKVLLITHQTKNSCSIDRKCFLKVYYLVLQADSEFFEHVKQSSLATVIDKIDSIMNIRYEPMIDDQATMDQYFNAVIGSINYQRLQESSNSTRPLDIPIFPNETPQQCAQQILTLSYIQQDQYESQLPVPPTMVNNDLRRYQRDYKHYLQRVGTLYCARMANQGTSGVINQGAHGMINNGPNGMANQGTNGMTNRGASGMINNGPIGMINQGSYEMMNQGAYGPTNHSTYGFSNQRTFGFTSNMTSYNQLGQQNYNTPPFVPPNVYGKQYHELPYSSNITSQQYQGNCSTSSDISDYHYSTASYPTISPTSSDISRQQLGVRVYSRSSVSYDTSGFQHQSQSTCSVSSDGSDYHRQASDSLYPYEEQQLYCSTSSMSSDDARHHYQGHQTRSPVGMMSVGSYGEEMTPTTVVDIGCYAPGKRRISKWNCRRRKSCRTSVGNRIDQGIVSPVTREGSHNDIQEVPESVLFVQELMRYYK